MLQDGCYIRVEDEFKSKRSATRDALLGICLLLSFGVVVSRSLWTNSHGQLVIPKMNTTATSLTELGSSSPGKITEHLKNISSQVQDEWMAIGLKDTECVQRMSEFFDSMKEIANGFLASQQAERASLETQLAEDVRAISSLKAELGDEASVPMGPSGNNLQERIKSLQSALVALRAEKSGRLQALSELRSRMHSMSKRMGMDMKPQFQSLDGALTPSLEQEFRNEADMLEREQQRRQTALNAALYDCEKLMLQLEIEPSTNIDRAATGNGAAIDDLGLSMATLEAVAARVSSLQEEKALREKKFKPLHLELMTLWDQLHVKQQERHAFLESTHGLSNSAIAATEAECTKLKALKVQKMAEIIVQVRDEIKATWEQLAYSDEQRASFHAMTIQQDAFDDKVLEAHQTELRRLNKMIQDQEQLLGLIKDREGLLKEREKMEALDADKSRKLPTGIPFIEETKVRHRIGKLPIMTDMLRKSLKAWSVEHGPLMRDGVDYLAAMEEVELAYKQRKESEAAAKKATKVAMGLTAPCSMQVTTSTGRETHAGIRNPAGVPRKTTQTSGKRLLFKASPRTAPCAPGKSIDSDTITISTPKRLRLSTPAV
eukprot:gnl/MRDRNA2_/MRDRNA2_107764_c0_seq1.p1 gnl/MRDRNA2_/MRDRNA2_107764_c0~~gnl/MRDRNA2_/MRDRNA2_107764_c0_seq1.p1  ORF type:complete len:603 (-),score=148.09 gnl/MRDRNA2_/MRDRNA2_107764_c0_seq1:101-1909(-)